MKSKEENYIEGVNHAFYIAKYNMPLMQKILRSKNDSLYFHGLVDGVDVFKRVREIERRKELRHLRNKNTDRELEK